MRRRPPFRLDDVPLRTKQTGQIHCVLVWLQRIVGRVRQPDAAAGSVMGETNDIRGGNVVRIGSILLIATVALPAACSDGGGTKRESGSERPVVSASSPSLEVLSPVGIGDATFQRVVTRDDAIEAGFAPEMVDEIMGDRGVVQFTVRFEGPRYVQYQRDGDGPAESGDEGVQYVDDEGHLVWVSESVGAPGQAAVLDWAIEGDRLMLTCLAGCVRDVAPDANLMMEGAWTRTG